MNDLTEVLNAAPDAIVLLERQGMITHANAQFLEMFGYPQEDLLDRSIETVMPKRFHKAYHRHRRRFFLDPKRQEMGSELSVFGLHQDKSEFPIEISINPARVGGELVAVCAVRDLSKRLEQDNKLREREASFRMLMEAAPDGLILSDSTGKILKANPQVAKIFGYLTDDLLGMNVRDLMPPHYRAKQDALLIRFLRNPRRIEMGRSHSLSGQRKNGETFPLELNISPIFEEDQILIVSSLRDITLRRKRDEELLLARQQADAANLAKSEFLSHMSHELRTPLNGILGYAQVLQQDQTITRSQRQSIDSIIRCGDHLLSLINDVLDLSKIEAGTSEVEPRPTHLHDLVHEVYDILQPRASQKDLTFGLKIQPVVPIAVLADGPKIRQILINLIGNAIKFTSQGSVSLSVESLSKEQILFVVTDTGIGIKEDEIEIIFDPFKQVEAGKAAGGTGLGLSICRKLATMLGGILEVSSTIGKGSTFRLEIPLPECESEEQKTISQEVSAPTRLKLAPGEQATVLVADDRATNLEILETLLHSLGLQTITVDDGDLALETLKKERVDLVLMDIRMPRMSGMEAIREIRRDSNLQSHKVVAVTASVFPDFRDSALEAGFDDFLSKPFRLSELIQILKNHLDVRFIDANDRQTRPSESLLSAEQGPKATTSTALPSGYRAAFKDALKIGSISKIQSLITDLADHPLASPLAQCAEELDFEGIDALID